MEHSKFYNRHCAKDKIVGTPLKDNVVEGRDFITVPKGVWKYFQKTYGGQELRRFSIV